MSTEAIASRALRTIILLLMALVPAAAIYALAVGGVMPGRPGFVPASPMPFRAAFPPGHIAPFEMPLPPPGAQQFLKTECAVKNGVRTCTVTERNLKPGEQLPAPERRGENFLLPAPAGGFVQRASLDEEGFTAGVRVDHAVAGRRAEDVVVFNAPIALPFEHLAGAAVLTTLWLILFLAVLYNLERLLKSFEGYSIFAGASGTERRLQLVGLCVIGLAFLPQLDIASLLFNTAASLFRLETAPPLPVAFPTEVNIALLLAGAFTVLIGRIIREAARLADEVEGTV